MAKGNKLREAETRTSDLENAMRAVGKALVDPTVSVPRRIDRAIGILSMYGCEPKAEIEKAAETAERSGT